VQEPSTSNNNAVVYVLADSHMAGLRWQCCVVLNISLQPALAMVLRAFAATTISMSAVC
jgi:hypothetical protein